jgi:glycerol-3-phosphate dehydrogenase (NAD(P)+)
MATVAVLGAGSWGSALAVHLARAGHAVALWGRSPEAVSQLDRSRQHPRHQVPFPSGLGLTARLDSACANADVVVIACPSHAVRAIGQALGTLAPHRPLVISTAKGIEAATALTMSGVLAEVLPAEASRRVAVLSGPSFADEVAKGLPTAVTAASPTLSVAEEAQRVFAGPSFRVYTTVDTIGVEIGGAVKNVIALAAGVSDGLGFGANTRAALITRGLAEMARLAMSRGADRATLAGLSGLGDLVLTCTGDLSRNRQVGLRLGRGENLSDIVATMSEIAEGVRNTEAIHRVAQSAGIDMPITEQMYRVLYEDKEPKRAVAELMSRTLKQETA